MSPFETPTVNMAQMTDDAISDDGSVSDNHYGLGFVVADIRQAADEARLQSLVAQAVRGTDSTLLDYDIDNQNAEHDGDAASDGDSFVSDDVTTWGPALPLVLDINGYHADLKTPMEEFRSWNDFKLICLAGPKLTVVVEEYYGAIEIVVPRKLITALSGVIYTMCQTRPCPERLDIHGMFWNQNLRTPGSTFIQLYEMMQCGGFILPFDMDLHFMEAVDMFLMAGMLQAPYVKEWLTTFAEARIEELQLNWGRNYAFACEMERDHPGEKGPYSANRFPIAPRTTRMEKQIAILLDIQEAYLTIRADPRCRVVQPAALARLVSSSCPDELRDRVKADHHMDALFLSAVGVYDLNRRITERVNGVAQRDTEDDAAQSVLDDAVQVPAAQDPAAEVPTAQAPAAQALTAEAPPTINLFWEDL